MISAQDLTEHVRSIRQRITSARIIGFESTGHADLPPQIATDQSTCRVVTARSELAIRRALLDFEGAPRDELLVVVTPLQSNDLVEDVRARMAGGRLWRFDPWEAVMTLFGASELDGRLRRQKALGRALLRSNARVNFEPVVAGQLTEDEAWHRLLHTALSLPDPIWSLDSWITWSMRHADMARRLLEDEELMHEVVERVEHNLGEPGVLLLALLSRNLDVDRPGERAMVVALGVRAADAASQRPELAQTSMHARADLTASLEIKGNAQRQIFDELARAFSRTYSRLKQEDPSSVMGMTDKLDAVLEEIDAMAIAPFSRASRAGWGARHEQLADSLQQGDPDALREALALLDEHNMAREEPAQMRRLRDIAQLAYYCNHWPEPDLEDLDVVEASREYIASGSYIDMIRQEVATADLGPQLHDALADLLTRATARRDRLNRAFAASLTQRLEHRRSVPGALAMHDVLEKVVTPIAKKHKVLMIVLDGASWAVLRALQHDALRSQWRMHLPGDEDQPTPLFAALPSITKFSRTSLLTGKLQTGDQHTEKKEFVQHPRLREAIGKQQKLSIFHKGELDGVGGVGESVREAILDDRQGVVAVVVNTVDDQLGGAQQLSMRWTLDAISPLKSLLDLAHKRRVVVLTSDHGHVWEDRSERLTELGGVHGRHRVGGVPASAGEVKLTGPMANAFCDDDVILAVDERMRHSSRHRGYHGGATLQEVVTPLVLLTDAETDFNGVLDTTELSSFMPAWSKLEPPSVRVHVPESITTSEVAPETVTAPEPAPQLDLLAGPAEPSEVIEEPQREAAQDVSALVESLLNSELYNRQLAHVSSLRKSPEDVYRVLVTLLEHEGRAHVGDLARAVQKADTRIRRLIAAMSNALNIDGYSILQHDRSEDLVRLDRDMLLKQFELGAKE